MTMIEAEAKESGSSSGTSPDTVQHKANLKGEAANVAASNRQVPDFVEFDELKARELWNQGLKRFETTDLKETVAILQELLFDDEQFEQRLCLVTQTIRKFPQESLHLLGDTTDYLRELWWLATGTFAEAFEKEIVDRKNLARMLMHPKVLKLARTMVLDGEVAFDRELKDEVERSQAATWRKLSDRLRTSELDDLTKGMPVAVTWYGGLSKGDVIGADNEVEAAKLARERWLIPITMLVVRSTDRDDLSESEDNNLLARERHHSR